MLHPRNPPHLKPQIPRDLALQIRIPNKVLFKFKTWFYSNSYRGIWVLQIGRFQECSIFSGICHTAGFSHVSPLSSFYIATWATRWLLRISEAWFAGTAVRHSHTSALVLSLSPFDSFFLLPSLHSKDRMLVRHLKILTRQLCRPFSHGELRTQLTSENFCSSNSLTLEGPTYW